MEEKRFACCKFTIQQEKEIIEQYKSGLSMAKLGKQWQCDPSTIKNILKAYNEKSRTLSEARRNTLNYTINENIFEKIDTPEKAYWLGVMYSDGYISKRKYTNNFGLSVAKKDEEWLEKFKKFLNYNGNIHTYEVGEAGYKPGVEYVRLLIGNNKIVQDLEKLGVVEHKSKKLKKIPDIPYKKDFIRGYIDGDGSLRTSYPHIIICGTFDFLNDIANYFNINYKIYPDKTIYGLHYNVKESTYLERELYLNATYYLERKYKIAQRSFDSPLTLEDVKVISLN